MVYYVSVRQHVFRHLFFNSSTETGPNPTFEKQSLNGSSGRELIRMLKNWTHNMWLAIWSFLLGSQIERKISPSSLKFLWIKSIQDNHSLKTIFMWINSWFNIFKWENSSWVFSIFPSCYCERRTTCTTERLI